MLFPTCFVTPTTPPELVLKAMTLFVTAMSPLIAFDCSPESIDSAAVDARIAVLAAAACVLSRKPVAAGPLATNLQNHLDTLVSRVTLSLQTATDVDRVYIADYRSATPSAQFLIKCVPFDLLNIELGLAIPLVAHWLDINELWQLPYESRAFRQIPPIVRYVRSMYGCNPQLPEVLRLLIGALRMRYMKIIGARNHGFCAYLDIENNANPTAVGFLQSSQLCARLCGKMHAAAVLSADAAQMLPQQTLRVEVLGAAPFLLPGVFSIAEYQLQQNDCDGTAAFKREVELRICRAMTLKRDIRALLRNGINPGTEYACVTSALTAYYASTQGIASDLEFDARFLPALQDSALTALLQTLNRSGKYERVAMNQRSTGLQHACTLRDLGLQIPRLHLDSALQRSNTPSLIMRNLVAALFGFDRYAALHYYYDTETAVGMGLYFEILRAEAGCAGLRAETALGALEMFDDTALIAQFALRSVWLHNLVRGFGRTNIQPAFIFHVFARELMCLNTMSERAEDAIPNVCHWLAVHILNNFSLLKQVSLFALDSVVGAESKTREILLPMHYFSTEHLVCSSVFHTLFVAVSPQLNNQHVVEARHLVDTTSNSMRGLRSVLVLLLASDKQLLVKPLFELPINAYRAFMLFMFELLRLVSKNRDNDLQTISQLLSLNPSMTCAVQHGVHHAWSDVFYKDVAIASPPNERLACSRALLYNASEIPLTDPESYISAVCNQYHSDPATVQKATAFATQYVVNATSAASKQHSTVFSNCAKRQKRKAAAAVDRGDDDYDDYGENNSAVAKAANESGVVAVLGPARVGTKEVLLNTISYCITKDTQCNALVSIRNKGASRKTRRLKKSKKRMAGLDDDDDDAFFSSDDDDFDDKQNSSSSAYPSDDDDDVDVDKPAKIDWNKGKAVTSSSSSGTASSIHKNRRLLREEKDAARCKLFKFCYLLLAEASRVACDKGSVHSIIALAPALLRVVTTELNTTLIRNLTTNMHYVLGAAGQKKALERQNSEMERTASGVDSCTQLTPNPAFLTSEDAPPYCLEQHFAANAGASAQNLVDILALLEINSRSKDSATFAAVAKHYFEPDTKCQLSATVLAKTTASYLPLIPSSDRISGLVYYGEDLNCFKIDKPEVPPELSRVQLERLLALAHLSEELYSFKPAAPSYKPLSYKDSITLRASHMPFGGTHLVPMLLSKF